MGETCYSKTQGEMRSRATVARAQQLHAQVKMTKQRKYRLVTTNKKNKSVQIVCCTRIDSIFIIDFITLFILSNA